MHKHAPSQIISHTHTQNDIHSKHYSVDLQNSILFLQTYQILNNAKEHWNFSNTVRPIVSRNSSAV